MYKLINVSEGFEKAVFYDYSKLFRGEIMFIIKIFTTFKI